MMIVTSLMVNHTNPGMIEKKPENPLSLWKSGAFLATAAETLFC